MTWGWSEKQDEGELPKYDKIPSWIEEAVGARFKELQNNYRQQSYFKVKLAKLKRLATEGQYPKTIKQLSAPPLKLPSTTPCFYKIERSYKAALETYKSSCLNALLDGLDEEVKAMENLVDFKQWSVAVYNEVSDNLSGNYVMPQDYVGRTMDDLKTYLEKIKKCWEVFVERIDADTKRKEQASLAEEAEDKSLDAIDAMGEERYHRDRARKRRQLNESSAQKTVILQAGNQMQSPFYRQPLSYAAAVGTPKHNGNFTPGRMPPPPSPMRLPPGVPQSPNLYGQSMPLLSPNPHLNGSQTPRSLSHASPNPHSIPSSPRYSAIPAATVPQSPAHIPPSPRYVPPPPPPPVNPSPSPSYNFEYASGLIPPHPNASGIPPPSPIPNHSNIYGQ